MWIRNKGQGHFTEGHQSWRCHELCDRFNNNWLSLARCCIIRVIIDHPFDHCRSPHPHLPTGECSPISRYSKGETFPVPASAAWPTDLAPPHKTEMVIGCLNLPICTLNLEVNMGNQMKIYIVLHDGTKTHGRMILKPVPSCTTNAPSILTFPNLFHSIQIKLEKDWLLLKWDSTALHSL